ncbi:hypothetical protein [Halobaculum lipolyticum]|uniref:DUF1102 domain-containing protein n=1 Tax=Halobaculum lipolyticum TaxID=3032001 RepID=A0ABD5WEY9_9EURY|nr:hypothetical protein [Halobaculum sp. DT31]
MQRRKFLAAMGTAAAGTAGAMGTGAFTSVSANRGITVEVAGDASAFLSLEPTDSPNTQYVDRSGDALSLEFDGGHADRTAGVDSSEVDGLNANGLTVIGELFDITNRGTQDVFVYMLQDPDGDGTKEFGTNTGVGWFGQSANDYYQQEVGGQGMLDTQQKSGLPPVPIPAAHRVDVGNTMPNIAALFGGYLGDIPEELNTDITIVANAVSSYDKGDQVAANDETFDL